MSFNYIQVPPNSNGLKVDTAELINGLNTVERQVMVIGDPVTAANVLAVDAMGGVKISGEAANAAPVQGNPVLIGGSDGANARNIATDSTGRLVNVGTTAPGAAVVGNPVLVGGSDGANARFLLTDSAGRVAVNLGTVGGTAVVTGGVSGSVGVGGLATSGSAPQGAPVLTAGSDGTNVKTINMSSATNFSAAVSGLGSQQVTLPGFWSLNHTPVAATQATITKAAGGAGVRHVCTSLSATLATIGTAQSSAIQLNLRDGVTAAGTILWSKQVVLPTNAVWEVNLSALNIVGSAATAMTFEFSAANAAASFASVSFTGYDIS